MIYLMEVSLTGSLGNFVIVTGIQGPIRVVGMAYEGLIMSTSNCCPEVVHYNDNPNRL